MTAIDTDHVTFPETLTEINVVDLVADIADRLAKNETELQFGRKLSASLSKHLEEIRAAPVTETSTS